MASKDIKGITVEIGGDVTPLEKALKSVDTATKELKSELSQINRLLKFDPKNATLLKQKYDVLGEEIKQTSDKLKTLKEAEKQAQKQFERGEISEKQYRALQREIEQTTQDLKRYERELDDVENSIKNVGDAAEDTSKSIDDIPNASNKATTQASGGWASFTTGVSSAINIVKEVIGVLEKAADFGAKIGSAISGFLKGAVTDTEEFRKDVSKLTQNAKTAGTTFDDVSDELSYFIALTDEEDSSVEALSNLLKTGFKGEGLTKAVETLSGAVIQFPDTLKIESLADSLQETLATGVATGQYGELLERLGVNLDTFNAGLATCTTEAEKQQYAIDYLAKNGLAEVNEEYKKSNEDLIAYSEAQTNYNIALGKVGEAMQPTLTALENIKAQIMEATLPAIETFGETLENILADPEFQKSISNLASAVGDVAQKFADWFAEAANSGQLTDFINKMADKLPELADSIINLIDALLGDGGEGLFGAIETITDVLKTFFDFLAGAKDVVEGFISMVEGMADAFEEASRQWQNFINGKGNRRGYATAMNGNAVYFAKGGIVSSPTNAIIGEAGSEAVVPLAKLSGIMAAAMEKVDNSTNFNNKNTYVMNVYPQDMTAAQQDMLFNKFNRFIGNANGRSVI